MYLYLNEKLLFLPGIQIIQFDWITLYHLETYFQILVFCCNKFPNQLSNIISKVTRHSI